MPPSEVGTQLLVGNLSIYATVSTTLPTAVTSAPTTLTTSEVKTFGHTTTSGAKINPSAILNKKIASKFTLLEAGNVKSLSVYVKRASFFNTQKMKGVIYSNNKGIPDKLKGITSEITIYAGYGTPGWVKMNFIGDVPLIAGEYWLGFVTGGAGGAIRYYYTLSDNNQDMKYNQDRYSDGVSDPFGDSYNEKKELLVYATYTPVK